MKTPAQKMKTPVLSVLATAVLVLSLASCAKDKDEVLKGSWELYDMEWYIGGDRPGHVERSPLWEISGIGPMRAFFFEDNTGMLIEAGFFGTDTTHFTYSVKGNDGAITRVGASSPSYVIKDIHDETITLYNMALWKDAFGEGRHRTQHVYYYLKRTQ